MAAFLSRAGYEVRHFFARFPPWNIGRFEGPAPFPSTPVSFDPGQWNQADIQSVYRRAVDRFDPDWVVITDSWNFKPLLAEAVAGYPYILRQQAMECLCPLNNVRLLVDAGRVRQCTRHQLATPAECRAVRGRPGRLLR